MIRGEKRGFENLRVVLDCRVVFASYSVLG